MTYISPRNIFTAFWAIVCLHPPTLSPVSSKCAIVLDRDLAAFQRVDPHKLSFYTHQPIIMHAHKFCQDT